MHPDNRLSKQLKEEILRVYHTYWGAYLRGDMKTFAGYLDEKVQTVGTAASEVFHNKRDALRFYTATADQMTGKAELRNQHIRMQPVPEGVLTTEESDLYVKTGRNWILYGPVRITALLHRGKKGWKVLHQHASFPDRLANAGEQIGTEKLKKENSELREAVQRRTRELEEKNRELAIDAALERVRTVAMGMKEPADMLKICRTISQQLQKLGVTEIRNVQTAIFYPDRGTYMNYEFYQKHNRTFITDVAYKSHRVQLSFAKKMMKGRGETVIEQFKGKQLKDWYAYQKTTNQFADRYLLRALSLNYYWYSLGPVALGISTYAPLSAEALGHFQRFLKVFELAYRRYMDIEKAEAQAREAQIEAALERIRARAMAMHRSEELGEVARLLFRQVKELGIETYASGFNIWDKEEKKLVSWMSNPTGSINPPFEMPVRTFAQHRRINAAWKNREVFMEDDIKGAALARHYGFLRSFPLLDAAFRKAEAAGIRSPDRQVHNIAFFSQGFLLFITLEPRPELRELFIRFANVFDQTYTRFLDLQKAETQAREAQIEASLERVRTAAMAMRSSAEIGSLIFQLYGELTRLDARLDRCFIMIVNPENQGITWWMAGQEGLLAENGFFVQQNQHPSHQLYLRYSRQRKKKWTYLFQGKEKRDWDRFGFAKTELARLPEPVKKFMAAAKKVHLSGSSDQFGCLVTGSFEPLPDEQQDILSRFATVFNQTYIRFLDLQKAEAQAREAEIELALERVRARTMAMQESGELKEAATVLYRELMSLCIGDLFNCGYVLVDEKNNLQHAWMTHADGRIRESHDMPLRGDRIMNERYTNWKSGTRLFSQQVGGKELKKHLAFVSRHTPSVAGKDTNAPKIPDPVFFYCGNFTDGYLHVLSGEPLSRESEQILSRFTSVFEQTYTRFLDLQKAEAQTREAQIEAALERVRAASMAMHRSDELAGVVGVLYKQFEELGFGLFQILVSIFDLKNGNIEWWSRGFGEADLPQCNHIPIIDHPFPQQQLKAWKSEAEYRAHILGGTMKQSWEDYLFTQTDLKRFPAAVKKQMRSLDKVFLSDAYMKYGALQAAGPEPLSDDKAQILVRFTRVLDQAYTRMKDLQQAEDQAREARVEAALERIRAKVTAMQESSDLFDIVVGMRREFISLGHEADYFWHMRWGPDQYELSMTSDDGSRLGMVITVPAFVHREIPALYQWEKSDSPCFVLALDGESAWDYVDKMNTYGSFQQIDPHAPSREDILGLGGITFVIARTTHGEIGFSLAGEVPEPPKGSMDTLVRFAGVFDLAHKRFEDLKEAERRHREAQIELALERVRARTMAMQKSEELFEAANVMFQQIEALGTVSWNCGFNIWDADRKFATSWNGAKGGVMVDFRTNSSEDVFRRFYEAAERGETFYVEALDREACAAHYRYMATIPKVGELFREMAQAGVSLPEEQIFHIAYFSQGYLMFITYEPVPHLWDIFQRFARVFEQTYTRFLDLKKAELQAREAEIQLALERVRARSLAMHHTSELQEVVNIAASQLLGIGMDINGGVFICINAEQDKEFSIWASGGMADYVQKVSVPELNKPIFTNARNAIKKGNSFLIEKYTDREKQELFKHLFQYEPWKSLPKERKEELLARKGGFARSIVILQHTSISITNHHGKAFSQEENEILTRFGKVFEQSYIRFLDLQKAEAQAREAQIEAALERVRSRSMAMHKSEELSELSLELVKQVQALGVSTWFCAFNIYDDEQQNSVEWGSNGQGVFSQYRTPREGVFLRYYEAGKRGEALLVNEIGEDECPAHYDYLCSLPGVGDQLREMKKAGLPFPTSQIDHVAFFKHGYIIFITYEPVPETHDIFKRFAKVFEQSYTRFLDLKKAEAQAREAQIEASLERVRSRTMGMQKSTELNEVAFVLFEQIRLLGGRLWGTGFALCNVTEGSDEFWFANEMGVVPPVSIPNTEDEVHRAMLQGWKQNREYLHWEKQGDALAAHYEYLYSLPQMKVFFDPILAAGFTFPTRQQWHAAYFSKGYLLIITTEPYAKGDIFRRFAKVFDQTYTRFLDLQKAEAQAREAEIQLALERVRARTMAMQKQTDLFDLVYAFGEQLVALGLKIDYVSFINGTITKDRDWDLWGCNPNLKLPGENNLIPHKEIAYFTKTAESIRNYEKTGNPIQIKSFTKNEKDEFFDHYFSHASVPEDFKQYLYNAPGSSIVDAFLGEVTVSICRYDLEPYSEEQLAIFNRFSKEFRQAYIRFLDLQKAEAQAREAQIEAALEKVRSRTMAMQSSEELADAAYVLFEQLNQLGVAHERINIGIVNEEDRVIDFWVTSQGGNRISTRFSGKLSEPTTISRAYGAWKNGDKSLVIDLQGEELREWLRYLQEEIKIPFDQKYLHNRRVQTAGFFSKGMLVVTSPEPLQAEAIYLLEKFAGVFDLTYTRFNDLKLAEAQARAAKIETALERVRARALAMQEPEELADVARVMRQEMGLLGVEELETSSIFIHDEERGHTECWYAIRDIRTSEQQLLSDHFGLDLDATRVGRQMRDYFQSTEVRASIAMKGDSRREWLRYCETQSPPLQGYYGEEIPDRHYHLHKFSHGAIGAASAGEISAESWELLQRAASVFSLAYSRFKDLTQARLDLQRLKEEKQRAETALTELQAAQKQLIQSEKMASLGELTAGIAHEIQNPLNFVNNFSEVSKELLDEMKEELEKGQLDLAREIMEDVIQNLEKINHHGRRADGIVKGMLQHSRSSSGHKEPTDINALCDEYLRLAYHGLRAKDKSFNAKFETDLDAAVGKINVLPQDLGRVILNLINNAFYAVSERKKQGLDGYEPLVTVSTKRNGDKIEIRVQDNGTGIPQKVLDKIFQPFFTTKPTGEGTGLGLSLSYDIVTKGHGGELRVETREGEGTAFIIFLPVRD